MTNDALRKSETKYRLLFENMIEGFAYCRMIFENGKPHDFIYLSVNHAFETLTGLKDVVGKRVTEVIPGIREADPELIETYGRVSLTGKPERFEMFVEALKMWLSISVYSPEKEHFVAVFDVITDRKRAESELKSVSAQRQLALDAARMGWWHYDPVSRISWWDERYKEIFEVTGYEKPNDEILATRIHPDDLPKVLTKVATALDPVNPQPYSAEYRINIPDGSIRWIEAHGIATFEGTGKDRHAISLVGTVADITERKRYEEEILRAREEWERTFDSVPDMIALLDNKHRIMRVNRAMADQLGLKPEECVGLPCYKYVHGLSAPPAFCPHTHTLKDGCQHMFELNEERLGGDMLVSTTPILNERGEVTGSVHVARNVSEIKKAEKALRNTLQELQQSEQRLNRSQEIAHLGSWELDLINNRLDWSDEVYRIFGMMPREFGATYEAFLEAVHPDDRAAVNAAYSGSLREGKDAYEIEHRIVRKSTGEIRYVHERCEHFRDESGQIIRSVGMVHDITERKKAEEEREKLLEELTRSNKELEQFAYIASHDLQEPLRMVSNYVQLIGHRYKSRLDKDADEFISYAVNGTAHMQTLLNDLLAYSRAGTAREPFKLIDLKAALDKALINLKVEIDGNRAEIVHESLPVVYADEVQMVQVFQNLLSNCNEIL